MSAAASVGRSDEAMLVYIKRAVETAKEQHRTTLEDEQIKAYEGPECLRRVPGGCDGLGDALLSESLLRDAPIKARPTPRDG